MISDHTRIPAVRALWRVLSTVAAVCLFCLVFAPVSVRAADAPSLEYPIKATFLEKFGNYVLWPDTTLPAATDPFTICIAGDDPFGPVLDETMRGRSLGTHPIAVRHIHSIAEGAGCHVAYLGSGRDTPAMLDAFRGQPILTVTDGASWNGPPQGIIHFVLKDNHVRFVVDVDAATANHLTISSKLLNVALSVIHGKGSSP